MNHMLAQQDLVVVVADKDMEYTVSGLLTRHKALGMRVVTADVFSHPEHDPGCYLRSHTFLRSMVNKYAKVIVLFDRDGCGADTRTREELEVEVEDRLKGAGWKGRCGAVVLDPELEIWVWSDSPHVPEILGWRGRTPALPQWLKGEQFWREGAAKPHAPKEAMQAVLRLTQLPRSASRYRQLAEAVSLDRCRDAAFLKLKRTLQAWFPQ
jgi:hypothetical protein